MKISIITASYNYEKYLSEAIESVLAQTFSDWELIVVDDGSSDNSVEIIKSYCEKDGRIKFFQHEGGINKGLKETLLLGLGHCNGDWVAFLESDDIFKPNYLAKKMEISKQYPQVKLVFNRVEFLEDGPEKSSHQKRLDKRQQKLSKLKFPRNMFYALYIRNHILTFSSVMVEKKALEHLDFNTPNDHALDRWLWIQLANKNDFYYIDEPLTTWRLHNESYIAKSANNKAKYLTREAYLQIFSKTHSLKTLCYILTSEILLCLHRALRIIKGKFLSKNKETL